MDLERIGGATPKSWTRYLVILPGLNLGLRSPRFEGTPDAAVVAQPTLNPHVSEPWPLYERTRE